MQRSILLKIKTILITLVLVLPSLILVNSQAVFATTILSNRSLSIATSKGGALTSHKFSFIFPVSVNIGSISFQYCTDPIDVIACVNPNGSDVSGAILAAQSGETGFAVVSGGTNQITLGRAPSVTGAGLNSYTFNNVTNPSDVGPFFVRISAYASSDGSGPLLSFSSVAGAITIGINVTTEVPDILYFCAAVSLPTTDCTDAQGYFIDLGALSSSVPRFGTSQFLVGTNAANGYNVTANGPTMTSGTDVITSLPAPTPNSAGSPQFGMNLRANLSPLLGADPTAGTGSPSPNYNIPNRYTYNDGDVIASDSGRALIELYTVSYIVNVKATQPAGVYNTTITYVCTAGF